MNNSNSTRRTRKRGKNRRNGGKVHGNQIERAGGGGFVCQLTTGIGLKLVERLPFCLFRPLAPPQVPALFVTFPPFLLFFAFFLDSPRAVCSSTSGSHYCFIPRAPSSDV